ncbi:Uncharacterised protein [Vibrio cholerae]|nr:Uncharacterised protein [Vibrio cholerae]
MSVRICSHMVGSLAYQSRCMATLNYINFIPMLKPITPDESRCLCCGIKNFTRL